MTAAARWSISSPNSVGFIVLGVPVPQGSMKGYVRGGHAVLTSDNAKLRPWRDSVAWAAKEAMEGFTIFAGPVNVHVEFYLPRPKSAPRKVTLPAKKPDLDKLLRAILDAMTHIVFADDSQVVRITGSKEFCHAGGLPGAVIEVAAWVTP